MIITAQQFQSSFFEIDTQKLASVAIGIQTKKDRLSFNVTTLIDFLTETQYIREFYSKKNKRNHKNGQEIIVARYRIFLN